jgi:carboxyl-terminal processing protease
MRSWMTGAALGALVGFATISAGSLAWSANNNAASTSTFSEVELFADVLVRVQSEYVTEIDRREAIDAAINGMLGSLDPHSSYLSPDKFRSMQIDTSGEYGGLGIEVTMEDGFVKVIAPIDDTPAARAGVESGDLIVAINGQPIVGQSLDDAVKEMRGEIGSDITISILRQGQEEAFDVTLTRELIQPRTVVSRVEEGNIGYVRISNFNERTTDLLEDALDEIRREAGGRPEGLVIDLRNNPGGLLDQAVSVSDLFLTGGEIVSTRGRRDSDIQRYNARSGEEFRGVPVIVLINGGSASAAEIVAGAIQDRGRGRVLGITSFGKGSVQTVIPLGGDRGALRLTTARYYTPSGRSIQSTGIEPDIEISNRRYSEEEIEKMKFFSEAALPNAMENEAGAERRGPHMPDEQPPEDYEGEDYQLDRALDILRGQAQVTDRGVDAG